MSPITRRLLMVICLLFAAGFARLGVWQLSRLQERRASNRVALAALAAPIVVLTGKTLASADSLAGRRVRAKGRYDVAHDLVLRGGALLGNPGVYVVTPLRIAGSDTAILVERGFVPAPDAVSADLSTLAEPGEVTVTGIARHIQSANGEPLERGGRTTWARIDIGALRARVSYPVLSIAIRQTPDSTLPRFPRRVDQPPTDEGPHLNYAIQWFLFAALAAAFAFLVIGRRPSSRRGA